MADWKDKEQRTCSKDTYAAVREVFHGLGRHMFAVMHGQYPHAFNDALIGLLKNTQAGMLDYKDGDLTGDAAKHKMTYEVTEAAGIPAVTQSDSGALTGHVGSLMTRLLNSAEMVQFYDAPRKPNTDANAQRAKEKFLRNYSEFETEIRKHEAFKNMLPIAHAVKALALQEDISGFEAQLFDPKRHDVTLPKQPRNEVDRQLDAAFPMGEDEKRKQAYYDQLALDYVIGVNAGASKAK